MEEKDNVKEEQERIKHTVKRVVIFTVILIGIILIINFIYVRYIFTKTAVMRADAEFMDYISDPANKVIDYAFFGTSHTRGGINPDYISPKAYNFGSLAGSQALGYYKLKKMLDEDGVKIENALFEIDMQTFSEHVAQGGSLGYTNYAAKFMPLEAIREVKSEDSIIDTLLGIYLPVLGNGEDLRELFMGENTRAETSNRGSILFNGDFTEEDQEISLNGAYVAHFKGGEEIDEGDLDYFLKTLELAKSKNINVILIEYPVTKEYSEYMKKRGIDRTSHYEKLFARINSTIENYTLLDYHDYYNDSSLFYDSNHLNVDGAKLFSEQLHKDLNVPDTQGLNLLPDNFLADVNITN